MSSATARSTSSRPTSLALDTWYLVLLTPHSVGNNDLMTNKPPPPPYVEDSSPTEADLETTDAAEAPDIAEALADRLEAELDDIGRTTGGEG